MTQDGELPPDARLIGGRYRLAGRLGTGPAGTVWRARDEQGQRQVAVKEPLLPGDPAEDEDSRRIAHRLYREARAATRVRHPSAVRVHDVVTDAGVPWIVMELVEGESLHEVLRRGPLPPAEAARTGLAVLGALRAAHAVGIVHRDLKPANVLLEPGTGRVVVTDFGIGAGRAGESPAGFAAPERAAGPGAGPASDLWSLGALLRAALGDADPGPLGPLLDRLHADEPDARPAAEHVEATLRAYLGLTGVPDETTPTPEPTAVPAPADAAPGLAPAHAVPGLASADAVPRPASARAEHCPASPEAAQGPTPVHATPGPARAHAAPGAAPSDAAPRPASADAPPVPAPTHAAPRAALPDAAQGPAPADAAPVPASPDAPPVPAPADAGQGPAPADAATGPASPDAPPVPASPDVPAPADAAPVPTSPDAAPTPPVPGPRRRTPRTALGLLLARKAEVE